MLFAICFFKLQGKPGEAQVTSSPLAAEPRASKMSSHPWKKVATAELFGELCTTDEPLSSITQVVSHHAGHGTSVYLLADNEDNPIVLHKNMKIEWTRHSCFEIVQCVLVWFMLIVVLMAFNSTSSTGNFILHKELKVTELKKMFLHLF